MSDFADEANGIAEHYNDVAVTNARLKAQLMPQGNAGECDLCGEWSGRLVNGECAPCRDRLIRQGVRRE